MRRLYRMHPGLPSLLLAGLNWLVAGCEAEPPPTGSEAIPDTYLEKLQEAEAVRYKIEQYDLEQQRLDRLLEGDQSAPPRR